MRTREGQRADAMMSEIAMILGGQRTLEGQSPEVVKSPGNLRVEFIVVKAEVMKIPSGQKLAAAGVNRTGVAGIMILRPVRTKIGMLHFKIL